ncbi:MAG: hypothetical protein ABFS56_12535 [Pseudomonadota bacterium]
MGCWLYVVSPFRFEIATLNLMSVVYKSLGKIGFMVYFLTILAGSLLFGLILDGIFEFIQLDLSEIITINEESNTVSSILLGGLLVYYLIVMPVKKKFGQKKTTSCCCSEEQRIGKINE